jgi:hypothetical protein
MDRYGGPQTHLTIALLTGLYSAIIFDHYGGQKTPLLYPCLEASTQPIYFTVMLGSKLTLLYIALLGGLYSAITLYRYGGPKTPLTIALLRGVY